MVEWIANSQLRSKHFKKRALHILYKIKFYLLVFLAMVSLIAASTLQKTHLLILVWLDRFWTSIPPSFKAYFVLFIFSETGYIPAIYIVLNCKNRLKQIFTLSYLHSDYCLSEPVSFWVKIPEIYPVSKVNFSLYDRGNRITWRQWNPDWILFRAQSGKSNPSSSI